jgi:uncharacterized membrane protein
MAKTKPMKEKEMERLDERESQFAQQLRPSGELHDRMMRDLHPRGEWAGDGWRRGGLKKLNKEKIAYGLGLFSIGLGLVEIAAPRGLAKLIGVRGDHSGLLRMLGAREIASGVGILTDRRPVGWLWSRVVGDAMDLALLGAASRLKRSNRSKIAMAVAAVAGVTVLDVLCSRRLSRRAGATTDSGTVRVAYAVTINRSPEELYRFWRDFQNLPRFMKHLKSVQALVDKRSHWVAKGPAGTKVEWDAEIVEDRSNEFIAWRSLEGADVDNVGSVQFERAPGGRGTVVRVNMWYRPPAGVVGATLAKLFGEDPEWQIKDDLRRFKQIMEIGEIITTEGQPAGRASSTSGRYDWAARS